MSNTQQHLIRRQSWHITATTANALDLQAKVARLVHSSEFQQRLSDVFDAMVSPQEWLVLERLDIKLNDLAEEKLETQLVEQVVAQVQQQLEQQKAKLRSSNSTGENGAVNFYAEDRTLQAFCYFLEHGALPWWYEVAVPAAFEDAILTSFEWSRHVAPASAKASFKRTLATATGARRLINQFSEKIYVAAVALFLSDTEAAVRTNVLAAYQEFKSVVRAQNLQAFQHELFESKLLLLTYAIAEPPAAESWIRAVMEQLVRQDAGLLQAIYKSQLLSQSRQEPQKEPVLQKGNFIEINAEKLPVASTTDGVIIKNAGLILAAPFLPALLSACNLMSENKLIYVDKAIALLHYLVYGHTDYREYDALLNKVLCGVPETENIVLVTELSVLEKEQIEVLLCSMISHWGALKRTSPDGLREGFLQRRGKLTRKEGTWYLLVEHNTLDILLYQLPWTISYIKLPWMKEILQTEWG